MSKRNHQEDSQIAPLDDLGREIHSVLDDIKPKLPDDPDHPKYEGYCGAASEASLHLSGGRASGLKVMTLAQHWWLEDQDRRVIDLTLGPADLRRLKRNPRDRHLRYSYQEGQRAMFRSGYGRPSKRAATIIELVESRR